MTITTEIIETKLDEEDELFIGEDEEEPTERIANGASKCLCGRNDMDIVLV